MRRCSLPGCKRVHKARGYCEKHYKQWKKGGLEIPISLGGGGSKRRKSIRKPAGGKGDGAARASAASPRGGGERADVARADACCRVSGCGGPVRANGYCTVHYKRLLLIMTKRARDGLRQHADGYYDEEAETTDEVAYPEDLDEMESDSSIFLYDYLDKGLPSDSDYE